VVDVVVAEDHGASSVVDYLLQESHLLLKGIDVNALIGIPTAHESLAKPSLDLLTALVSRTEVLRDEPGASIPWE
jgi:hypothetical protein